MPYTEDEKYLLAYLPQAIGTAIASASSSGLFGTGKEIFANARAVLEGATAHSGNGLIGELMPDPKKERDKAFDELSKVKDWATSRLKEKGIDSGEKLRVQVLEDTRTAASLLSSKASREEAIQYKQWALSVAEKVASAAKEGGFLGFGGERVTSDEKNLIAEIRKAFETV